MAANDGCVWAIHGLTSVGTTGPLPGLENRGYILLPSMFDGLGNLEFEYLLHIHVYFIYINLLMSHPFSQSFIYDPIKLQNALYVTK